MNDEFLTHIQYIKESVTRIENNLTIYKTDNKNQLSEIYKRISSIEKDVAGLNVKAGVWGIIGGTIPVAITIAVLIIRGGL